MEHPLLRAPDARVSLLRWSAVLHPTGERESRRTSAINQSGGPELESVLRARVIFVGSLPFCDDQPPKVLCALGRNVSFRLWYTLRSREDWLRCWRLLIACELSSVRTR